MLTFKELRELIGNSFIIGFGIWSLFSFIKILTEGKVIYIEPNMFILVPETIIATVIILYGIERTIDDIREFIRRRNNDE